MATNGWKSPIHTIALVGIGLTTTGTPAAALVASGHPAKAACYAEWQVTTPGLTANRGKAGVDCQDGDPACDIDGKADGVCTIGVSVCVFQSDLAGCTPQPIKDVKLSRKAQKLSIARPPLPASAAICGQADLVSLPLRAGKKGPKPSKTVNLQMTAVSSGRPRRATAALALRCVPNSGAGQCPANPAGGPRALDLAIAQTGTDLDNGWTGGSQNFPLDYGTVLHACLKDCDASGATPCTGDDAATSQVNGPTFGAPMPLFTVAPVCLVPRYGGQKFTDIVANVATGDIQGNLHLLADIYITSPAELCPRCSGSSLGVAGTCDSGPRQGQACTTDGIVTVATAPGNKRFTLSSDCPPAGTPATLTITLPLTTGTSTLQPTGSKPCPGQVQDDNCAPGVCNVNCSAVPARLGGQNQYCCSGDGTTPCFPTSLASGIGRLERTGTAQVPMPSGDVYPKTANGVLVATFCEPVTRVTVVDQPTGLPGPGAAVLPVAEEWIR